MLSLQPLAYFAYPFKLKQFLKHFVYHARIRLALHGLHGLSN